MLDFKRTVDEQTGEDVVDVLTGGFMLLGNPMYNKGSAYTHQERRQLNLLGLLPPHESTQPEQLARSYLAFKRQPNDLERHINLRNLQDRNEVLFYQLLQAHIREMLPIVYTPVVGMACEHFSTIYRRHRGLFIDYPHRGEIDAMLDNRPYRDVDVIVVTDGERILGLGDQGVGGMGIPVGKLSLYTLCGGIHPSRTLPVLLDVGTDNPEKLKDPLYLGWRHERVRGQDYDDFIEAFIQAVKRKLPRVLLQWEDFAQHNARRLLERYRDQLCCFNDDIQGTAAVTLAALWSALQVIGAKLEDQRVVILGAGSAGTGISDMLLMAMQSAGLDQAQALSRFWLVDRNGLLHAGMTDLNAAQRCFARTLESTGWERVSQTISLREVVQCVRPTILIGTSGQPCAFTEEVVRTIAQQVDRPIILPLSNPTSRCEATAADLIAWTEGRALIATGSPFLDVPYRGRLIRIGQCNNSYIFPGVGLGVIASGAQRVTEDMFLAAAHELSACSPARNDPDASLFPALEEIRMVSRRIALAVGTAAQRQRVAEARSAEELARRIDAHMWTPRYPRFRQQVR
jgi:malate dehydrogenase (oxaloacetate-decarboxylating)